MNHSALHSACAAVIIALALTTPSRAPAAEGEPAAAPDGKAARSHFERGVGLFEDGDFESALFEFETAYAGSENPHLLYNIAVAQYELHRYAAATRSYRRYLDALERDLPAERLAAVQERLTTLELRVGTVIVESTPSGAVVSCENETLGVTPAEFVIDLGERVLVLEKEGYETQSELVRVVGGERTVLTLELAEVEVAQTAPDPVPPPRDPVSDEPTPTEVDTPAAPRRGLRTASIVVGGVAGLAGVGAVITGVLAVRADRSISDELATQTTTADLDSLGARRDTLALTTDVLIGVGAAAAVTSLALGITYLAKRKRAGDATARRGPHLDGLAVRF